MTDEDRPVRKPPTRPEPKTSYEFGDDDSHSEVAAVILAVAVVVMVCVALLAIYVYALRTGCQ